MKLGRLVGLYGLSGSGKTTQAGEYAKWIKRMTGLNSRYIGTDMGGFDSISHLEELGILKPEFYEESSDPWSFVGKLFNTPPPEDVGLYIIDSGTSIGEVLISDSAKKAAKGIQVGQEKIFRMTFQTDDGPITIGANNKSQYGLIQTFMLDQIRRSTWFARRHGIDILWTFGEHRGEDPNDAPIVGPLLAGKALTGVLPKQLNYILRLVSIPVEDKPARHVMYIQEKPELMGTGMSFANSRYPLSATTQLPPSIEPASIITFWELVEQGRQEALEADRLALGL